MRKIAWVCIAALIMSIVTACGRVGKMPEGLVKKDIADTSDGDQNELKDEAINSPMVEDDSAEVEAENDTAIQQNASLYFLDKDNNKER